MTFMRGSRAAENRALRNFKVYDFKESGKLFSAFYIKSLAQFKTAQLCV